MAYWNRKTTKISAQKIYELTLDNEQLNNIEQHIYQGTIEATIIIEKRNSSQLEFEINGKLVRVSFAHDTLNIVQFLPPRDSGNIVGSSVPSGCNIEEYSKSEPDMELPEEKTVHNET